jgi:tRNA pseudouridine55 synthase
LLSGTDKTYDASVRLGFATETDDAGGAALPEITGPVPDVAAVESALEGFKGTFLQLPPQYSAKRVDGAKAYELARKRQVAALQPVEVTVRSLTWLGRSGDEISLRVTATAGFYVRALARDLGARLGCGAHLSALRRIASGGFTLEGAVTLDECERLGQAAAERLIAPADALPHLLSVEVNDGGLKRAVHGNTLEPVHLARPLRPAQAGHEADLVRILGPDGRLVGLGRRRAGALHPVVVLG